MGNHNATQNVLAELRGPDDCENSKHTACGEGRVVTWGWSAGRNHVSTERNSLGNSPPSEIWRSALHSEEPGPTSVSELTGQRPWLPLTKCTKAWCTKLPKANSFFTITTSYTFQRVIQWWKFSACVRLQILRPALYTSVAANDRLALET